jgi:3-phenylpropionate/cinnamic acid dioxygenase small subunit
VTTVSERVGLPLETRLAVEDFLVDEALLLDDRRFDEWFELFADDLVYQAPVRVTAKKGHADVIDTIFHFDENKQSLGLRVRRLGTDVAWAEDPPSVTRHCLSNIRVTATDTPGELAVRAYVLLYRARGDRGLHDLLSYVRWDVLRPTGSSFQIASRRAVLDQGVLGTKNLAVFL